MSDTHSLSQKHETNSRPVTTLVFHPVTPVRGTAFPYGSCPKFVTELHPHSRKIIQSGGCCKLSDQWLQEVQPQGHCGTVVQPGLTWHSHFSSNNNSLTAVLCPCTNLSLLPAVSVNVTSTLVKPFQLWPFTEELFPGPRKRIFHLSKNFCKKLLSNSKCRLKPKPSPPNFTSSVLASPFSAGRLSFVCSWFVSSVCFPLGPFFPLDWAFLSSDLSYKEIHFQ